jgi:hypothetical protein
MITVLVMDGVIANRGRRLRQMRSLRWMTDIIPLCRSTTPGVRGAARNPDAVGIPGYLALRPKTALEPAGSVSWSVKPLSDGAKYSIPQRLGRYRYRVVSTARPSITAACTTPLSAVTLML